ncbi:MAG TPA: response regulator transcription factor [Chloroflexia bacterium]|nr:response regulator transcription factor [Chloroflexia bacterium]
MSTIRVLVVEDHTLVRAGMRALLRNIPGVEVVAEAGDGHTALRLIEQYRPDVVLMDIALPGLNGLDTLVEAKQYPGTHVIILSMHANDEYVRRALQAGAVGYLLKGSDPPELELAVRAGARGDFYLSPAVSKHVVAGYVRHADDERNSVEQLTPRQRQILQLIAEGRTTQEIATILTIGTKTVETHRAHLMERLDIHDVAGLVRYAIRAGMIMPVE